MRVADLFCGAGGISEGFRLAGFEIAYGLDLDRAATETFKANHPDAVVIHGDASKISADSIPDVDVIVGGPPCKNFSSSKGGRANPLEGLRLVQSFLRIVYQKKPKYWVMENVPRIVLHLPARIPLRWIGIDEDGLMPVPNRGEFVTTDFGTAQTRKRHLMGNFPTPAGSHTFDRIMAGDAQLDLRKLSEARTLGRVVDCLPSYNFATRASSIIADPIYDIKLSGDLLTDQHHDVVMTSDESDRIRAAKVNHPYMGRMSFPDDLLKPARTVVATQLGRETLVLATHGGRYRRPTVRECASLQSFPITYQFHGGGLSARYRLVGDAVPPLLSFAIAAEIAKQQSGKYPKPVIRSTVSKLAPPAASDFRQKKVQRIFPANRKFTALVPGKEVRGWRAEFDNLGAADNHSTQKMTSATVWQARLYTGEGKKNLAIYGVSFDQALAELSIACDPGSILTRVELMSFLDGLVQEFRDGVPDATSLQARWIGLAVGPGPEDLVRRMSAVIQDHFPPSKFSKIHLPASRIIATQNRRGLRLRIVAGLVAASFVADRANRPDRPLEDGYELLRRVPAAPLVERQLAFL